VFQKYLILFSIIFIVLVGCGNNPTSQMNQKSSEAKASTHDKHTALPEKATPASSIPNKETKYYLDASTYKENEKYYLKFSTNLKLSSEHYEGSPIDGEGHIHFYLNGNLIGPILDAAPYPLEILEVGTNKIKLVLAQNDHSESFGTESIVVSKELSIERDK
jgi:hypothetical protein